MAFFKHTIKIKSGKIVGCSEKPAKTIRNFYSEGEISRLTINNIEGVGREFIVDCCDGNRDVYLVEVQL